MTAIVDHVIVLMLENRSFDHLWAYSGLPGLTGTDTSKSNPGEAGDVSMSDTAVDRPATDPKHEFENVDWQIYRAPRTSGDRAATLTGFVDQSGPDVMRCVPAAANNVLTQLARDYCVCDNWFSSMPGPTWPNRFFVHAGSSGGLANSPSSVTTAGSELLPQLGFSFPNGTIYDKLAAAGKSWRVYYGDDFPQVCAIDTMPSIFVANPEQFRSFAQFAGDMQRGDVADYTFIEPNYSILSSFRDGNSQHPLGSMSQGEVLIKAVYDALSGSSAWRSSMLIIAYDEHGGFYDQVPPPGAVPPGDGNQNAGKAANPPDPAFPFDRLGVRVPAVVVSPWIAPATVSHTLYDHAAVIRTVFDVFELPGQLTDRDGRAASLVPLLGPTLRAASPLSVTTPASATAAPAPVASAADSSSGIDGFTRIAAQVHQALLQYQDGMQPHELRASVAAHPPTAGMLPGLPTTGSGDAARAYIASVAAMMAAHRRRQEVASLSGSGR